MRFLGTSFEYFNEVLCIFGGALSATRPASPAAPLYKASPEVVYDHSVAIYPYAVVPASTNKAVSVRPALSHRNVSTKKALRSSFTLSSLGLSASPRK